jgi:hypothetical protein
LSAITRFLYLKWYRNWFSSSKDNGKLDDYLARLNERVAATIPASCKLSKQWRDAPAP